MKIKEQSVFAEKKINTYFKGFRQKSLSFNLDKHLYQKKSKKWSKSWKNKSIKYLKTIWYNFQAKSLSLFLNKLLNHKFKDLSIKQKNTCKKVRNTYKMKKLPWIASLNKSRSGVINWRKSIQKRRNYVIFCRRSRKMEKRLSSY